MGLSRILTSILRGSSPPGSAMNILKELEEKIEELQSQGLKKEEIINIGYEHYKSLLKKASFKERCEFFKFAEREKKIKQILGE